MEHHIHSYSKIYSVAHVASKPLLKQPVWVEEKIDGSQFSMLKRENGEVVIRSKNVEMDPLNPNEMFNKAAETALNLDLHPGWVYRGEYLQSPKHNTLAYDRVPKQNIILFDIEIMQCEFLTPDEKAKEAERLGLEVVPFLFSGVLESLDQFVGFLEQTSVLGGQIIEGVVIKPQQKIFGNDGKIVMAKHVREDFKEENSKEWKNTKNLSKNMIVEKLIETYDSPARINKAIQHLRETGELQNEPRDIPKIIKELQEDLHNEEEQAIKDKLYAWAKPLIMKGVARPVPIYYKQKLLQQAFDGDDNE